MRILLALILSVSCVLGAPFPQAHFKQGVSPSGGGDDAGTPTAFWPMNESSAGASPVTREDSIGTVDLTDDNNTASTTGKLSLAADIDSASTDSFSRANDANLQMNTTTGGTVAFWVKFDSFPGGAQPIISKWVPAPDSMTQNIFEWSVWVEGNAIVFRVGDNASSGVGWSTITHSTSLTTGVWYFVVCVCDVVGDLLKVSINGGAFETATLGGITPFASSSYIFVGRTDHVDGCENPYSEYLDGQLDAVGFWKGVVFTQSNVAYEYNNDTGRER